MMERWEMIFQNSANALESAGVNQQCKIRFSWTNGANSVVLCVMQNQLKYIKFNSLRFLGTNSVALWTAQSL